MFKGRVSKSLLALTIIAAVLFALAFWQEISADINSSPTISVPEGTLTISVEDGEDILLSGVTAEDPEDGDVTDSLVIEGISEFQDDGSRVVTYAAFDSTGNVSKVSRTFYYSDYTSPEIILLTDLVVQVGEQINLQNCIRVDDVLDGNITSRIQITESDYSQYYAGTYDVTLEVTNSAGDTETVTYQIICTETDDSLTSTSLTLTAYSTYLEVGEDFDASSYINSVSGRDDDGKSLTASDVVIYDTADTDEAGQYTVSYTLTSVEGTVSTKLIVIVR